MTVQPTDKPPAARPAAPASAIQAAAKRHMAPQNIEAMNEEAAAASFNRLRKMVKAQIWIIGGLSAILVLMLPLSQTIYSYYARKPEGQVKQLVGLTMPNMTNYAVLSWATTSITEIMTIGFGDMDYKLPRQKWRFTKAGWASYVESFAKLKTVETFKKSRLVLTTVPSNTPVILEQGLNKEDHVYQWIVQMPIIMTYATNNNVEKQQSAIVTMTIVRVPADANGSGIAIKTWVLG